MSRVYPGGLLTPQSVCLGENDIVFIWCGNVIISLGLMTYFDVGDLIYDLIWMEDVAGKQSAGVYFPSVISVYGSEILAKS